ncbi:MAG: hypothetical protein KBT03_02585 [Bacteroidales bacterium]|nr:hypothetical protein [Candidatus Scybalousia scybalohippi]
MNFTQLITEVQKVALKQHNVNSFSSEDVYEYWNRPHTQYASVNIGLESADRTENTIIYNCVLYYGDRLLQNASNKIAIQDDAVKVLQGIISNLPDEITYYTPINYTIFEQEFADYIAGAYCRVRLETEFDQGNCSLDDYIEELKTLYVTENGIFNVAGYDQVEVHVEGGTVEGITEEECREIIEGYDFATKDEIPSLEGYATEQWVNDQGFLTEHQDLSEYAKIVDVNTALESKQDKGDYALRSELPDLTPYATKQYVQDQIIEAGGVTIEQVDTEIENKLADKNYATKDEIPSLDGYATESWVENKGYLTEHQTLKTINGESIVGTGNIEIESGSSAYVIDATQDIGDGKTGFYITQEVIDHLNDDSNPVYMKVKFTYISGTRTYEYTTLL